MCDKPAVTREHTPPKAFFPSDLRDELITVPSCRLHNNDNSKDVEYVRNIVVPDLHTNATARRMFNSKVLPSFRRSPKLRAQTFRRYRLVDVQGMESAIAELDTKRFGLVMRAVAMALYYHDFGERFKYHFRIHSATNLSENVAFLDLPDPYTPQTNAYLRTLPTVDKDTSQPEVFRYGVYREHDYRVTYRMVFYGGVEVYAYGTPPGSRLESIPD